MNQPPRLTPRILLAGATVIVAEAFAATAAAAAAVVVTLAVVFGGTTFFTVVEVGFLTGTTTFLVTFAGLIARLSRASSAKTGEGAANTVEATSKWATSSQASITCREECILYCVYEIVENLDGLFREEGGRDNKSMVLADPPSLWHATGCSHFKCFLKLVADSCRTRQEDAVRCHPHNIFDTGGLRRQLKAKKTFRGRTLPRKACIVPPKSIDTIDQGLLTMAFGLSGTNTHAYLRHIRAHFDDGRIPFLIHWECLALYLFH